MHRLRLRTGMSSAGNVVKLVVGVIVAMSAYTGVSEAATRTVTVSKAGNGSGTVVSQGSAAINCGSTCSASIPDGAIVTLVATPSPGTRLNGFSGTPCYRVGNTCQVVIWGSDVSITATFVQVQPLTVNFGGTGDGQVTSAPAGTDCIATCTVDHETGSTVTLTAAPRNFSRFGGWSGGGCSGFATCVVSMDAAKSVTATFIPLRQLRVEVPRVPGLNPGGRISSTPAGINGCTFCAANFDLGQTVKLTAVADENWDFDGWRGDRCNGVTTPTCDVIIDWGADVRPIVRASFSPRHLLTVATQGSGTVTSSPVGINCGATCSARFPYGERITLTPQAAAGYRFVSWTGCTSGAYSNPCIHQPGTDTTVTANFVEVEAVNDHVLSVTLAGTGQGSVSENQASIRCPGTCEASYRAGTTVTLTAQTGGDSAFAGWSGAGCSGTGTCTVTMNQATQVTATFNATRGTLNIAKTGGGTGTVTSQMNWINCGATCSRVFTAGEKLTLTATPGPNSLFAGWSGGGCSGKGPCEVTIDRTKTVTATFVPGSTLRIVHGGLGQGAVTALPSGAECTSGTCVVEHDLGTVVTLTATPKPGTRFAYWTGDDCNYSTSRTCTTTLNSDTEIHASFMKEFTLNVSRAGDGLGIVTAHEATPGIDCGAICTVVKVEGSEMVLIAKAYAGSRFVGWSGGGEFCDDTDPECALPMYSDYSVTATFVRDVLQPDPTPDPGGTPSPAGGNPPASGGTTAAPSVSPPTQPSKLRFVATGTRRGKQVNLRLRFTGAPAGKLAVTVRLYSGKKLVARSGATVRSGQARATLRANKAVRKGRYRVLVSVGKTKLAPVGLRLR